LFVKTGTKSNVCSKYAKLPLYQSSLFFTNVGLGLSIGETFYSGSSVWSPPL